MSSSNKCPVCHDSKRARKEVPLSTTSPAASFVTAHKYCEQTNQNQSHVLSSLNLK
ncbi:hypothetical protein Nmel_002223 [Mimus melanotis]